MATDEATSTAPELQVVEQDLLAAAEEAMATDPAAGEELLRELLDGDAPVASVAGARYLLARRRVQQGRPEDALVELGLAARAYEAAGDEVAALRTTLGRMHALDELGRHAEAVAAADETMRRLDELDRGGDVPELAWLRAALAENRGVALGYAGRTVEAIDAARAAYDAWSAVGAPADLARAAGNLGVELLDAGRAAEALPALEEAVAGFEAAELVVQAGVARAHVARARGLLGEPMQALVGLDEAIAELDAVQATAERDRARAQRAIQLLELGWWHGLAAEAASLEEAARHDGRQPDEGHALLVRAASLLATRRLDDAAVAARDAARLFAEVGEERARASAVLLQAQACLTGVRGREDARALCEEVVRLAASNSWVLHGLRAQLLLARVELREGRHGHAAALAVDVRRTAQRLGTLELEADAEHLLALAREAVGEIDQAIEGCEQAVLRLEQARARLASGALHAVFLQSVVPAHDDLVRLLLDRSAPGDHHRASEVAALRDERTLVELRRSRAARTVDGDETARERSALLATHGGLRARLDAGSVPGTGRVPATGETRRLLVELEELATELRRLDLQDTRLTTSAAPPAVVAAVGRARSVASVGYQFVGEELLAFIHAGPALIVLRELATLDEVRSWTRRIAGHWRRAAQPDLLADHATALRRDADRDLRVVARAILDPVLERLPAVPRLAIVPRGPLLGVPFAALPLDDTDDPVRLVDRTTVQTAVVARPPADLGRRAAVRHRIGTVVVGGGPAAPPAVHDEVRAVARVAGDRAVLLAGEDATAAALVERAVDAAVLHLAGHGVHDPRHPALSGIRLADRWVSAAELGALRLDGVDVVLSACDSARRSGDAADVDTSGLVSAILAAGARTVTSSLWPVDDAATARLMPAFHANRARGFPPDRALAAAQQQVRLALPHPYAWAAFTCQVIAGTDLTDVDQEVA